MINTKRCIALATLLSSITVGVLASPASASSGRRYFNTGYQDYPTPGGFGGWHSNPSTACGTTARCV